MGRMDSRTNRARVILPYDVENGCWSDKETMRLATLFGVVGQRNGPAVLPPAAPSGDSVVVSGRIPTG